MSSEHRFPTLQVGLVALFVTALMTAQVTASKLLAFELPFAIPVAGDSLVLPGAAVAYALTFFASDCYAELYGRRPATVLVNVGFAMNLVLLALIYLTIELPIFAQSPVGQGEFATVLGASASVVAGSLTAYVVSQNWDVLAFHWLRDLTDGRHLWLRNVGSTASSQLIDTILFITVAFWLAPQVLGGRVTPLSALPALIVGQYVLKLAVALADTPFVYGVVALARRTGGPSVADYASGRA